MERKLRPLCFLKCKNSFRVVRYLGLILRCAIHAQSSSLISSLLSVSLFQLGIGITDSYENHKCTERDHHPRLQPHVADIIRDTGLAVWPADRTDSVAFLTSSALFRTGFALFQPIRRYSSSAPFGPVLGKVRQLTYVFGHYESIFRVIFGISALRLTYFMIFQVIVALFNLLSISKLTCFNSFWFFGYLKWYRILY